jgi:hypothetical protein
MIEVRTMFIGFDVLTAVGINSVLLLALFADCFVLISCLAYASTLKMEAICFSETSVYFYWTIRRYSPEGRIFQEKRNS